MPKTANSMSGDAQEAWVRMRELVSAPDVVAAEHDLMRELGLLAGPVRTLRALLELGPRSMGALAEHMGCDKSYVTGLVKPLLAGGLVTIEPHKTDGRVKVVTPTERGLIVAARAKEVYDTPPAALTSLTPAELQQLCVLLASVAAQCPQ